MTLDEYFDAGGNVTGTVNMGDIAARIIMGQTMLLSMKSSLLADDLPSNTC